MKRSVQAAKMEEAKNQVQQAIETIAQSLGLEIPSMPIVKRQSIRPLHEMQYFAGVLGQIADVTSMAQATTEMATDLFPELVAEPVEVTFPEGFPEAELLLEAGFTSETIPTTREELEAIDGIGPKKATLILEALEDGRSE